VEPPVSRTVYNQKSACTNFADLEKVLPYLAIHLQVILTIEETHDV
jgi:hypothetical protein